MVDCLGWAAAEAVVGVKQGYESIALYGDVLVNVIMSSTPNTEMGSKETPEAPKRQNEDEREDMWIITTKLMDWENQLVFLLFISSSLLLQKNPVCANRCLNLLVQHRLLSRRQRHDIIVLVHGMPKSSSTGLSTLHKLRDVLSNPDRR